MVYLNYKAISGYDQPKRIDDRGIPKYPATFCLFSFWHVTVYKQKELDLYLLWVIHNYDLTYRKILKEK